MTKRKRSRIVAPPRKLKRSVARRVVASRPPAVAAVYPDALLDTVGLAIAKLGSWEEWRGLGNRESVRAVYHGQAVRALDAYRAWKR
jgi:hypothetical protein